MNSIRRNWKTKKTDWKEFGYRTMLTANDEASAIDECRHALQDHELQLQPDIVQLNEEIGSVRAQHDSLHLYLYDRPVPVDDASMLIHSLKLYITLVFAVFMSGAGVAASFAACRLYGSGIVASVAGACLITVIPLAVGHLAYEKILSGHKALQTALILVITFFGIAGFYEFGQARRMVFDKAMAQSVTSSYVDDDQASDPLNAGKAQENSEAKGKGSMGETAFLLASAAELALGFFVGLLIKLRTDKEYAAWRELKKVNKRLAVLNGELNELLLRIERAKHQCMAGIRRAQDVRNKRRAPYHKALTVVIVCLFLRALPSHAQTPEHLEGILIDSSTSVAKGGAADRSLFQQYVASTKTLLASEQPKSHVWVLTIASDSFGGVQETLSGWTPGVHGVFSDDLNRARRQLTTNFEAKSATLAPTAAGTDILGALWHMKTLFESAPNGHSSQVPSKTIWIFSDMMNETRQFPMPELLEIGPERMLERAKAAGLVVPLPHYQIYIYGASTGALRPRTWMVIRRFWELYFQAAGAELVGYSAECNVRR